MMFGVNLVKCFCKQLWFRKSTLKTITMMQNSEAEEMQQEPSVLEGFSERNRMSFVVKTAELCIWISSMIASFLNKMSDVRIL